MKLTTLSIAGVLAFPDRVDVDFSALPEGLIAIQGPNGSGKTSLLESAFAAVWRSFPSRSGSLVDYATRRDASLTLGFTIPGRGAYRSRVTLDPVSRASSAVLEHTPEGSTTPVLLNDGKLTTFDAVVAGSFPSPALVLASVFAAQSRAGSFTTANRAERRALFASLLGLDSFEALAVTSRDCRKLVQATIDRIEGMHAALIEERYGEALALAESVIAGRAEAQATHLARRGPLEEAVTAAAAHLDATIVSANAARALELQRTAALQAQAAAAARVSAVDIRRKMIEKGLEGTITQATATRDEAVSDLRGRITNNETVLAQAASIRADMAIVDETSTALVTATAAREAAQQDEQRVFSAIAGIGTDLAEAARRLEAAQRDSLAALQVDRVPCHGDGEYGGCQFLRDAVDAAHRRRADPMDTHAHDQAYEALAARSTALHAEQRAARSAIERANNEIALLQATLRTRAGTTALMARLEAAEGRLVELRADLVTAETRCVNTIAMARLNTQTALAELMADADQAHASLTEADAALHGLEAPLAALGDALARERAARAALADAQQALAALAAEYAEIGRQVLAAQGQRATALEGLARVAAVADLLRELGQELLDWGVIIDACSRTGIPTLEMDAAGPTVAAFTNDLLHACFGGRFSVDLITQDATADGKGTKEVFEIRVYDADRDGADVDLADLSGGERVIVDEAVKCAIAMLGNQRLPWPMLTLWRDETTGALDPVNATRYVEMLRRMQARTGVSQILYITHSPDAARMADAQIHVGGGTVRVAFPPFPVV